MSIIRKHLSDVSEAMTLLDVDEVRRMVNVLNIVRGSGGTVYLFGNGGSHSTASHFANDLMKMARIRAVCLGDMSASMLAYGNDNGWVNMYSGPLREMFKDGDAVVGISCSGRSANVVRALGYAVSENGLAIGLTGLADDSEINYIGLDALVHARFPDIRVQEDLHLMVCHAVVRSLQDDE